MMSEREKQWLEFSDRVAKHLREYTVPQYGDVGEDLITNYDTRQCVEQVTKYAKRFGSNAREGQQELDFIKIAHYTQCAWEKWENTETEETNNGFAIHMYNSRISHTGAEKDMGLEYIGDSKGEDGKTYYIYKEQK